MNDDNKDLKDLSGKIDNISGDIVLLRKMLLGDLNDPGSGYIHRVRELEREFQNISRSLELNQAKLDELSDWIKATKSKLSGLSIGLALGSAGVGATLVTILQNVFS